jgi:hypothetical protein
MPKRRTDESFWQRLTRTESGCWEWNGHIAADGYGQLRIDNKAYRAHRRAWELAHGPIPVGLHVCHRCDNPPCCNPDHLFLGTDADNIADKCRKGRAKTRPLCGEANPDAKLTADQVRTIRATYADGAATQTELAVRYGVTQSTIWLIIHRKKWKAA